MTSPTAPEISLSIPQTPAELGSARALLREYADSLGIDLCFQGFEAEVANLPGDYAPPAGALLMATVNGESAGCCGLRPLDSTDYPNACEMKRLYVRPAFRRLGLGRRLAEAIMEHATTSGYAHILLDTLDEMEAARSLYQELGFIEIAPYYHNPIAGAHYLKATL